MAPAWSDPEHRPWFDEPLWALQLLPTAPSPTPAPAAVDTERLAVDQLTVSDLEVVFGRRAAVMDRKPG